MADNVIDTLNINIEASSKSSKQSIDELIKSLESLKNELKGLDKLGKISIGTDIKQAGTNAKSSQSAISKLADAFKKSGTAAKGLASGLKNLIPGFNKAKSGSFSLVSALGKLYATIWAIKKLFGWAASSMEFASDLVEVQNVVRNAFGPESEKMINDFAGSLSMLKFGMSELTTKEIASTFQAMGKTLGITNNQVKETQKVVNGLPESYDNAADSVADMSLNLTKLAADMGSFYNKEASDVAQSLQAVFTGQTRPLMLAA